MPELCMENTRRLIPDDNKFNLAVIIFFDLTETGFPVGLLVIDAGDGAELRPGSEAGAFGVENM